MQVGANRNARHAHHAHNVVGLHALPLLDSHLAQVAVEQVDVHLAARHAEAAVQLDDHGVAIEIGVGAEDVGVVHAGVHHLACGGGAHGRAKGVGNVHAMMGAIASAARGAELVGGGGNLVLHKGRVRPPHPEVRCVAGREGRPLPARRQCNRHGSGGRWRGGNGRGNVGKLHHFHCGQDARARQFIERCRRHRRAAVALRFERAQNHGLLERDDGRLVVGRTLCVHACGRLGGNERVAEEHLLGHRVGRWRHNVNVEREERAKGVGDGRTGACKQRKRGGRGCGRGSGQVGGIDYREARSQAGGRRYDGWPRFDCGQ